MVYEIDFIEKVRSASKLAASTLEMLEEYVKPGVTTKYLNEIAQKYMEDNNAEPAPLTKGFPAAICTSPNYVICHGIPNEFPLKDNDILNIDISLRKDGAFADTCKMFFVGKPGVMAKRIVQCAHEALYSAINIVRPDENIYHIGYIIEKVTRKYGYSIVREFCGHGVGKNLHEKPQIPHYYNPHAQKILCKPGMIFTIEPMINVGIPDVRILSDKWTAVTKDRSLSAQFEHTILVTTDGYEILTLRSDEDLNYIKSFTIPTTF